MEDVTKDDCPPTSTSRQAGFGRFVVKLAGFLTLPIVINLATYFEFPPALADKLGSAEYAGQLMVDYLRERGIITPTDISKLIKALEFLKLDGVKLEVLSSFQSYVSESHESLDKLTRLRRYLKAAYKVWYKAIRPIPYIRDRLYCVKDVFVEGGIEVSNDTCNTQAPGASSLPTGKASNKLLKSYRDIFDDSVLPSKRVLVEGEPGYGKSTLTLQAAYDWCEDSSSSVLRGVELFILLPLRLMKGRVSIYQAVKLFILPRECNFSESEIKDIIDSCTNVVIVLDGFDEYPDVNSDLKSDFMETIKGKMFINHKVILFTRLGCLPPILDPRTVRIRLTGFDEGARDRYIRLAVVGDTREKANDMKRNLQKNPIMCDLCQVPLFFVMFAHMAHESKDIYKCDSVTSFFKYMIHCFYSHMWKKDEENGIKSRRIIESSNRLNKVVFNGLAGDDQTIVWDKDQFCRQIGTKCYEQLIKIGILVEETYLQINNSPNVPVHEYVKERCSVRFYHKLFAEWYAAHYLAERSGSFLVFGLKKTLMKVNPLDLQFVFRFACGLKPSATKRIVNYLRTIPGGDPFATLCILEKTGGTVDIIDTVRDMCSGVTRFSSDDNQLLQRSRIQLLSIASKNQIRISGVTLWGSFQSVDLKEESLCLSSGLQIPRLDTLQELKIWQSGDLRDRARGILDYCCKCAALKTLQFGVVFPILLPESFEDRDVLGSLHRKNCKVTWECYTGSFSTCTLNLKTGKWENEDGKVMTDEEYTYMAQYF